jgi:hypothetical protein
MTDISIFGVSEAQFKREVQAALQLLQLPSYTVATLPSAVTYARGLIYVSDEIGGAVPAFSDGTNWRRVTDRIIIS